MSSNNKSFAEKLRTMNLDRFNDKGELSNEMGWSITTRYKMQNEDELFPSVQVVVNIRFNGGYAGTWGCTKDDQAEVVSEIILAEFRAEVAKREKEINKDDVAEKMWNNWKW